MIGPDVPQWLRSELWRMPYHQYAELSALLDRPDGIQQIEAVFAESLQTVEDIPPEYREVFDLPDVAWSGLDSLS